MPDWLSDFAVAEKLGIPVREVAHQPLRWRYRAGVVLDAEAIQRREQMEQGRAK